MTERVLTCLRAQVWPVLACMAFGGAWCAASCGRFLFVSPDTHWVQGDRGNLFRTNFAEGKRWTAHRSLFTKSRDDVAETSVIGMETINRWVAGTPSNK